jgi:hypothetical protein
MGEVETPNTEVHEHRDSTVYKVFQEESAIIVKNVPYIKLPPYNQTSIAAVCYGDNDEI